MEDTGEMETLLSTEKKRTSCAYTLTSPNAVIKDTRQATESVGENPLYKVRPN